MHIPETFIGYRTLIYSYSSITRDMRILFYYMFQPTK